MDAWSVYKKENPWKHFKKYWHPIILNLDTFVANEIRIQLYYSLMYPFLILNRFFAWRNSTALNKPVVVLQKKAVQIIT